MISRIKETRFKKGLREPVTELEMRWEWSMDMGLKVWSGWAGSRMQDRVDRLYRQCSNSIWRAVVLRLEPPLL